MDSLAIYWKMNQSSLFGARGKSYVVYLQISVILIDFSAMFL
jgi:hypothetical protein